MLIDSHCHVPHKKYGLSIDEIIVESKNSGIEKLVNIGTSVRENKRAVKTAESYDEIYSTIGIYPHENMDKNLDFLLDHLRKTLLLSSKIVGIGECGIDISPNWKGGRALNQQIEIFNMQVDFAIEKNLPICIHNRNGTAPLLDLLSEKNFSSNPGVIHCYSDNWENAQMFLDLGFYISFSGLITYPKKDDLLEVVKKVPSDKFIVETDAPYLPPQGHRGETNFPKYVRIIADKVAQIKQIPFEDVERMSYENTCRLYNIK